MVRHPCVSDQHAHPAITTTLTRTRSEYHSTNTFEGSRTGAYTRRFECTPRGWVLTWINALTALCHQAAPNGAKGGRYERSDQQPTFRDVLRAC